MAKFTSALIALFASLACSAEELRYDQRIPRSEPVVRLPIIEIETGGAFDLAFDSRLFAFNPKATPEKLIVGTTESGKQWPLSVESKAPINTLKFSLGSDRLVAVSEGSLAISPATENWEADDGLWVFTETATDRIERMEWSLDGKRLFVINGGDTPSIVVINSESGEIENRFDIEKGFAQIVVNKDGSTGAIGRLVFGLPV